MSSEAWEKAVEAGARAVGTVKLAGVDLHEWLMPCSKGDCEALGIIWPEHPHDRHREISDCQIELFTERWTEAALRAAFPILAEELMRMVEDYDLPRLESHGIELALDSLRARIEQMKEQQK
jgi:hypothetical protein